MNPMTAKPIATALQIWANSEREVSHLQKKKSLQVGKHTFLRRFSAPCDELYVERSVDYGNIIRGWKGNLLGFHREEIAEEFPRILLFCQTWRVLRRGGGEMRWREITEDVDSQSC
jgi:hypothetical protein